MLRINSTSNPERAKLRASFPEGGIIMQRYNGVYDLHEDLLVAPACKGTGLSTMAP